MPIPSGTTDVHREPLREIAAQRIREAIFDGTLQSGEKLNDEELQGWLGMSRTPVREALNDLARVGLVEMSPQRYTRVAAVNPDDRVVVLQTLGALIGGVVRVTTRALSDQQRAEILAALGATMATVEARDSAAHAVAAWAMLDLFIDACPNPYLVRATRDQINALMHQVNSTRTDANTMWENPETAYPLLHEAITTGDSIAAELAVETVFRL